MGASAQKSYEVHIKIGASVPSMQDSGQAPYNPPGISIPVKSKVTWTNDDESFHTVTSGNALTGPDRIFDSGILSPKVSWSYTFNVPREYDYYCTVHPFMKGLVSVASEN